MSLTVTPAGPEAEPTAAGMISSHPPTTMLAAFVKRYGRDALQLDQLPIPTPEALQDGEILVRVHAVSLQPADYKTRDGSVKSLRGPPSEKSPRVLGYDCSGTVVAVSPSVASRPNSLKVGDAVFGIATYGALASHTVAHIDHLAKKPDNVSFAHAAAVVTAGLTAWQTFEYAKEKAATLDKVFVTAGPGGVGHVAIQLAKAAFNVKTVATTASASKHSFVRECGADVVVDYRKPGDEGNFVKALGEKAYDLALDSTGEKGKCKQIVRPGGAVVSVLGIPDGHMLFKVVEAYHMPESAKPPGFVYGLLNFVSWTGSWGSGGKHILNLVSVPSSEHLAKLGELMASGQVKTTIDRVYPLSRAKEAFAYLEQGHVIGRVVVECLEGDSQHVVQLNPL